MSLNIFSGNPGKCLQKLISMLVKRDMIKKFEKQTSQIFTKKYLVQQITSIQNHIWKIGIADNISRIYQ